MSEPIDTREGGCRCGALRFRVTAPPLLSMACHCRGCQRMTGSAFSLSVAVPADGFAITQGEAVIGGLHGPMIHHFFCPRCMSWVFTRAEGMEGFVNVRSVMFDDPRETAPFIETWTQEKLPWVSTPATHSFPAFPAFEDYERLTRDYAARRTRDADRA